MTITFTVTEARMDLNGRLVLFDKDKDKKTIVAMICRKLGIEQEN